MNICNKYFKIVIYKETVNIHSGVQKLTEKNKHLALESPMIW